MANFEAATRRILEPYLGFDRTQKLSGAYGGALGLLQYRTTREGRESTRRIAELRDAYRGKRCFIIGNGPSLRLMDLSPLRNEVTFGLNRIYLLFPELGFSTTFLVAINRLVLDQKIDEIVEAAPTVFVNWWSRKLVPPGRQPILLRVTSFRPRFSRHAEYGVWSGGTVTYASMQLAYHMGFEEVILIGVDHSFVDEGRPNRIVESTGPDRNHFHPEYFGKGFKWQHPDLETSEAAYRLARRAFEEDDRRIVDATVGGKLAVFPKVDFTSLFERAEN
jgi:6-hydroxymethylpterin diphosphokinase MptE-like protein